MNTHSLFKTDWITLSCVTSMFVQTVPTLQSVSCDIDTGPDEQYQEQEPDDVPPQEDEDDDNTTDEDDDEDTPDTVKVPVVFGKLSTRDRDFMLDNTMSTSVMFEAHFYRLLVQRQAEFEENSTAIKRMWANRECETDVVLGLIKHAVSQTNSCTWSTVYPAALDIMTTTLDGELGVVAWAWACKLVQDVQTELVVASSKPANHMIEEEASLVLGQQVTKLRKAASLFLYLSARGTKEGFSNHASFAPVYVKAFVCKAYEALAISLCHVITANHLLSYNTTQSINPSIVVHMTMASSIIQTGYNVLRNDDGIDDAGGQLLLDYFFFRMLVQLMSVYHVGRYHVVNKTHRDTAVQHMKLAAECPLNDAALQARLKDAIVPFEKMQSDESASLPLLSMISQVVMTGITVTASLTSGPAAPSTIQAKLLSLSSRLHDLPLLPPVSVANLREYKAIGIEKVLFGK